MNFIELGKHKIEVRLSNGKRMIKQSDVKELLDLKESEVKELFIDASLITDTLFTKIYVTKNATIEQEIIHKGLCLVGIYSLIDEVCKVDLKDVSYCKELNKNLVKAVRNQNALEARKIDLVK